MNRSGRDYLVGGRNFYPGSINLRRGQSLNGGLASSRDADEDLDLFSRNRRSISVASSDESPDASALKLGRFSVGSAKLPRSGVYDLLSSDDGKNDYDWLLTPPGTPLFAPSDRSESQPTVAAPRTRPLSRSTSTTKVSRLSVSQSEVSHSHSSRPTRSSSVTRSSSISTSQFSTYSSNNRSSLSSILNTSSASVSSYIRPSSPITRSSATARSSTPSSTRSSTSRPSTPSRVRPGPTTSSIEKPRPAQTSRPSTPSSRPHISTNPIVPPARVTSRPSTPTRRNSAPSLSQSTISSISTARVLSNGSSTGPSSRPSSPGPRIRPPQQPIVPADFPLDTPPNLRTTLPDRPLSTGRSRPVPAATAKGNSETAIPGTLPKRQSSPIVARGRLTVPEPNGRGRRSQSNIAADVHEPRKVLHSPDMGMKKPVKNVTNVPETNGLGRTISKKSLDMAIRHMDIRNGTGSLRALSNTTLFPQSIRSSSTSKTQSNRASVHPNGSLHSGSDVISENGSWIRSPENGSMMMEGNGHYSAKLSDFDLYESSRYDAILLKEDMKNTNWLHSGDDKSEVGSIFDNGFETLPEPFGPL